MPRACSQEPASTRTPGDGGRQQHGRPGTETLEWTRRNRDLWTGRRCDLPAGTIERGTRFTEVDDDGEPHRGSRSLADAQRAPAGPITCSTCGPGALRRAHPLLVAVTTGAVAADLLLLGGAWLLSR